MLIAHGPLGYLIAYASQRYWQPLVAKPQHKLVFWAAAIGGIFPDIDLLYFYFINSSVSHRQLLTHSFLTYGLVLLITLLWLRLIPYLKITAISLLFFTLGAISHICADMFIGMAAGLAPISNVIFGLISIPWYRDSVFIQYNLTTNFTAELVIIMVAIGTLIRRWKLWLVVSAGAGVAVALTFVWLNGHAYKPDGWFYYNDADQDGAINAADRDIDGDQLVNMIDPDIDNDGIDNSQAFYLELFSADQALFDYSFGYPLEIALRLSLVNDQVMVQRLFANTGIFFTTEMAYDYAARPDGYRLEPTNNQFAEQPNNVMTWLGHTNHLLPADAQRQEFDLIFFQSGMMAVFTRLSDGSDVILDVDASHPYARYEPYATVVERESGVIAIGRVLPKPFAKRY